MTKFVELAQTNNAHDFQEQVNTSMGEKIAEALEAKKSEIAKSLFEQVAAQA